MTGPDRNKEIDAAIRDKAAGVSFGRSLLEAGLTAVVLDDDDCRELIRWRQLRSKLLGRSYRIVDIDPALGDEVDPGTSFVPVTATRGTAP